MASGFLENFGNIFNTNKNKNDKDAMVEKKSYGAGNTTLEGFYSGRKSLSEKDILSIPAASAAMEIITNSVSHLPVQLLHNVDTKAGKEPIDDDNRLYLINQQPNPTLDGADLKKRMIKDILLYGSSKNYIKYADNGVTILGIFPLDMEKLTTTVYSDNGYEFYGIDSLTSTNGITDFYDELLFSVLKNTNNGIIGRGVIEGNEDTFLLALRQSEYESNLIGNGAMPTGMLTTEQKNMDDSRLDKMRRSFASLYAGTKNTGKTIVLGGDLKYQSLSLNPDDLQLTAGKKSVISDIARIFNIPESMINSAANKYDSTEQNNLWFLTYTLSPLLISIENALNRNFLTQEERDSGYEFRFDTTQVSRITPTENQQNTIAAYNAGIITNISAKRKIGEKIIPGEPESYKFTTGSVIYIPEKNQYINPNTGEIMNGDTGGVIGGFSNTAKNNDNNKKGDNTVDEQDTNGDSVTSD